MDFASFPHRTQPALTGMRGSRFDLDGRAAPAVFLHPKHPLAGHLVGILSGAHRDLVLDDSLTLQFLSAITDQQKQISHKLQMSLLSFSMLPVSSRADLI